ncbi:MAG: DUF4091 domain-containing protein [Clostridia bacterium]|nr:DUF4091 domain-containing protein [Clostridia bacterium]
MIWFESSMKKIIGGAEPSGLKSYAVNMARGEFKGCQAVFVSDKPLEAEISVCDAVNENGNKVKASVFGENYIRTVFAQPYFADEKQNGKEVYFPDALFPLKGGITLSPGTPLPVYVLFDTHGAAPGDYVSTVSLVSGGKTLESGEISVHVWDFELPERRTMSTAVGLIGECIAKMHGLTDENGVSDMYRKYYDFLLEHNCSAYQLPYDILDERVDRYLDDPRVTSFVVPYADDDAIRAYHAKLSRKKEWIAKSFFYPLDEPQDRDAFLGVVAAGKRLEKLFPGYRLCVPFFVDPDMGDGRDGFSHAAEVVNVWCAKLACFDSSFIYDEEKLKSETPFAERMLAERLGGDDVWWYVCCDPGEPYANLYVNMQGAVNRSIFWQADVYGVNGFLYWCTDFWEEIDDPWKDADTVRKFISPMIFGDGALLYNGNAVGIDGPCSSLRLEAVRDGIDDFELISMARRSGVCEDRIRDIVGAVAKSVREYSTSDAVIERARKELGDLIEKALKG